MYQLAIDPIAWKYMGLEIHWYAVFIVFGAILGGVIAHFEAIRQKWDSEIVSDFIIYALPLAIIGARIYYVFFLLSYYIKNPLEIIMIWRGGLAVYGGLIAGFLFLQYFAKWRKISQWKFLDILAPSVALGQGIGRWGNFVNQEAYGVVVEKNFLTDTLHLPNFIVSNMEIDNFYRTPTFLYESVWCIFIFILLVILRFRLRLFKEGQIFLSYVALYSLERFFVEDMRTDSLRLFGGIRVSQVLSCLLFVGAVIFFIKIQRSSTPFYNQPLIDKKK